MLGWELFSIHLYFIIRWYFIVVSFLSPKIKYMCLFYPLLWHFSVLFFFFCFYNFSDVFHPTIISALNFLSANFLWSKHCSLVLFLLNMSRLYLPSFPSPEPGVNSTNQFFFSPLGNLHNLPSYPLFLILLILL